MTLQQFQKIINNYQSFSDKISHFYSFGLDLTEGKLEVMSDVEAILEASMCSVYGKEGWEWVAWFIFENDFGKRKMEAYDGDKLICYDIRSLYEYLQDKYSI